jgi:hypothetical protein
VGHHLADMVAIQDHVAAINPDALAGLAVVIEVQLPHEDEGIIRHHGAELFAVLARMLNDKLMDIALAAPVRHIHCDHKSHFSIPT